MEPAVIIMMLSVFFLLLSIIVGVDDKDFESTIRAIYHEFVK